MARRLGFLGQIFSGFRDSLFAAKNRPKFMGADQYGNKYFEKDGDSKHNLRASRYIEERRDLGPHETPEVPVEWDAWLRGRRERPPTEEEIKRNYVKMMKTKMRAEQLEQKHSGMESTGLSSGENQSIGEDVKSNETRSAFPTYDEYEISPGEKYNKKNNKIE